MQKYVDGFILVIPKENVDAYIEMAKGGRNSWMKHGALSYYECRGDDLKQREMGDLKTRSFIEMAGATENDTVWFSFITYNSKAHRDEVNAKVEAEMSEQMSGHENDPMPFDMKRMATGGFVVEVE